MVRLLPDGGEERVRVGDGLVVGRAEGDVRVPADPYLSGRHAAVCREGGRYALQDLESTNGTFIRISGEIELRPGDVVLIGNQPFLFLE